MNFDFIKTFGLSIVLTIVLLVVVNVIGDFAVQPKTGYAPIQMVEEKSGDGKTATETSAPTQKIEEKVMKEVVEELVDLPTLLANADPDSARKAFRKCKGCHASAAEARNLVGPNLWNVIGRPKASYDGFKYSNALSELGGEWSYEDLDDFLTDPRGYAKGTKMAFKGISKPADRALVIAYLRSLSDSPKPLP